MTQLLLSVVIPSRNDTYMGNSNWRLETTVNFLATALLKIDKLEKVEVVVVDWGSDVPLHSVLNLSEAARKITRFIRVPISVHDAVRKDSDFPDSIALNVGIRRSLGKFICQTGNDVLWPEHFLRSLFILLEGKENISSPIEKTQMIFGRKHIPWEILSKEPDLKTLCDFITKYDPYIPIEPLNPFFLTPGGSVIIHRDIWFQCRGYDETLIYWGTNDVNLNLRIKLRYPGLDMGKEKRMHVYHLQHYAAPGQRPLRRKKENPVIFGPFAANSHNWGLGDHRFHEFPPTEHQDVSASFQKEEISNSENYREIHLKNIRKFALDQSIIEGAHAMVHFMKDSTENRLLKTLLSCLKKPKCLKKTSLYERKINGPWQA